MVKFCGQEACLIDGNGRAKLAPRLLSDFLSISGEVILHCLEEGALAIYPLPTWQNMRKQDPQTAEQAGKSVVFRRQLRRFGAMSQPQAISNQGRVTIPPLFRDMLELQPGSQAILVGVEIGIEVWNAERWTRELMIMREHTQRRDAAEMERDLGIADGK